jgi:glycosyltransferase involved in cell wall biosynthesis
VGSSGQLVTLAAMQFRKVIIYANFNVVSQYFEDGFNGLMYKAGDVDCLIAKIESVFDDEEKIKSIGNNARKNWEQYFQRKNYEEAIYQHIIEFLHNY